MTYYSNPFEYFDLLFKKASSCKDILDASAFNLATASKKGIPSNRVLLLKNHSEKGFVFFTNSFSRKGKDMEENPVASMCFFWPSLHKQIRIEGKITKISEEESDKYFSSRFLDSRIGAWASKQSAELERREILFERFEKYKAKFNSGDVARPYFWLGYCLVPARIEFWTEGKYRLHERVLYVFSEDDNKWKSSFLYP